MPKKFRLKDWKWTIQQVLEDTRVFEPDRKAGLHYYECRHGENDWSQPISIEQSVLVNFWGTLVTTESLNLGDGVLELTRREGEELMFLAHSDVKKRGGP
ncbi:MAG TPA: hypothetical protein DDW94_11595 [Deltaproteobacteria bacterium]|nr:MAG: hypothetical protein A2Z79_05150 [Deltaproteobacteria bacterium GWA2_55_82]OGQ63839.1 MAG: hypothetical protein A3I81_12500 [Deltaproteobacteria bacterium RIFCSPLOWO2_02_FULL_55_12]OIJ72702.1 MAG: hypothetical protein A2V21_312725 [Deltaproteobacteria bacterium GWC2_55_46]HBG47613.1 hypothetical protein [Deltaproteobacteria bacterium]HCY10524.1 hypothetical protein [Deltaproteobacteria bacterium]